MGEEGAKMFVKLAQAPGNDKAEEGNPEHEKRIIRE